MSASLLAAAALTAVMVYQIAQARQARADVEREIARMQSLSEAIRRRRWRRVPGKVLQAGLWLAPSLEPERGALADDPHLADPASRTRLAALLRAERDCQGLCLRYRYRIADTLYEGRAVAPCLGPGDPERILARLAAGERVWVHVDPHDPTRSFLLPASAHSLEAFRRRSRAALWRHGGLAAAALAGALTLLVSAALGA